MCTHPKDIQCRAEDFPGISIDSIGQKVQCDITIGLVCNNKDQVDNNQCYNYQIKVLCCDDYSDCSTTPQTTSTTTTTTPVPPTTTETPPTTTPTTTTTTTTPVPPTTTTTTTTSVPPTTTTTPTTTTIPPSPGCKPQCKWTKWIDVDSPTSGLDGGDKETFENIMAKGKQICKHPQNIECRAEDFPEISIDNVGQIVQCDANVGLVCNNKDQTGKVKQCYNYQIKVLCCDDYSHCSTTPPPTTTPTTTSTTTTTTTTTPVPPTTTKTTTTTTRTTTTTKPPTTTETTPTKTTKCFCHFESENKYFSPGQTIYNKTDAEGCIFYAICNDHCEAERHKGNCPTTTVTPTTKPTTTSSTPTPVKPTTSTPIVPTTISGCPPKKAKETWMINNCTKATCHGNNVITMEPVTCPEEKPLSCANGFPPVKKMSEDGCCSHYECECVCSGWGDPHYITFDGTYYTFLDNCTYVLVQQITPKYDNFRVLVDNYFCDAEDGLSCPQSILIYYKSTEIVLTRMMYQGRMRNRIRFNNDWVTPGFTKDGITVSSAGINMNVDIPEIDAFISFSGMIFVIKLPFSKFGYNTEGQCGTCSNNSTEDCRLPSGKIVKDCSQMANHWKVNVTDKPYCNSPPATPPPDHPTPAPTCPPSEVCDIILSEVFADCQKIIDPKHFHEACAFDACRMHNASEITACSSLEVYASLCSANGVCVDWRDKTKGHCPYSCPAGKVYNACGPIHAKTCDSNEVQNSNTDQTQTEGCFCPKGTMLFNAYTDVCVKTCTCVGPEGMPVNPGATWTSQCKQCTCEKNSLTVQCQPLTCPPLVELSCEKDGFITKQLPDPEQLCCLKNECICNRSSCMQKEQKCPLGYEVVIVEPTLEEDCCPSFSCIARDVCVFKDNTYPPGTKIPQAKDVCTDCSCTHHRDDDVFFKVICEPIKCNEDCEEGTELVHTEDDCCGKCMPNACRIKGKDNTIHILKPGETWSPPDQPCSVMECDHIEDQYVPVEVRRSCDEECEAGSVYKTLPNECCGTCVKDACVVHLSDNTTRIMKPEEKYVPAEDKCTTYTCSSTYDVEKTTVSCTPLDRSRCIEGTITSDGCCESCTPVLPGCEVHKQSQRIKTSTCESDQVVELSFCGGACMTSSIYSVEANMMEHKCSCCQEVKTSKREVSLKCSDGTSSVYTYVYAEECGCAHTECQNDVQTSSAQQHEQVESKEDFHQDLQSQQTN